MARYVKNSCNPSIPFSPKRMHIPETKVMRYEVMFLKMLASKAVNRNMQPKNIAWD